MERHFKTSQRPFREDAWPEHGYVNLGNGETHWYMLGPVDGERLVFVHGMGSPGKMMLERLGPSNLCVYLIFMN